MKKLLGLVVCGLALMMVLTISGSVQATAVSFTQTFQNTTQTFAPPSPMAANPCTGALGVLTLTYNGVAHVNFITSGVGVGTGWVTFTGTGAFTFVQAAPAVTFTGKFTAWDGQDFNLQNFVATNILVGRGTGTDGSTLFFHGLMTITILFQSGSPVVVVSFGSFTCG